MSHPYLASDDPLKFTEQMARLMDREYSRTIATAIRPLGAAIAAPADATDVNAQVQARIGEVVDCFGGDPELAIHYLMVVLHRLLQRGHSP